MSAPGLFPPEGYRPRTKQRNKLIAAQYGCVLTGWHKDLDPAHLPYRRSDGAGWGLLEFVPLRHDWHRRYDDNDPLAVSLVDLCASRYYATMLNEHPDEYLGPTWRIEEVQTGERR